MAVVNDDRQVLRLADGVGVANQQRAQPANLHLHDAVFHTETA